MNLFCSQNCDINNFTLNVFLIKDLRLTHEWITSKGQSEARDRKERLIFYNYRFLQIYCVFSKMFNH